MQTSCKIGLWGTKFVLPSALRSQLVVLLVTLCENVCMTFYFIVFLRPNNDIPVPANSMIMVLIVLIVLIEFRCVVTVHACSVADEGKYKKADSKTLY